MIIKVGKSRAKGEEYDVYMLVGNATNDAETKQSKSGKAFSKVSVAAQQNPDSTTMFVSVMGFGGLNATIGSIKKGGSVFAIGKLEKNEYNGKTTWRAQPWGFRSIESIATGDYFVPDDKPLPETHGTGFAETNDTFDSQLADLPF